MTTAEFTEIEKKYLSEQKRWLALNIGQIVYEMDGWAEYFLCIVTDIDVHNRTLHVVDTSQNNKPKTISFFYTITELAEMGRTFDIPQEHLEFSKTIKREHNSN